VRGNRQAVLAGTAAQDRTPAMPVRVDETRHRDHAGRIDHLGTDANPSVSPFMTFEDVLAEEDPNPIEGKCELRLRIGIGDP
jgi:hypothetical protein